ncbi:hypothetical protein ACFSUM_18735 [Virgibacillus siamensis]|uniref:hypothetical protein n=1 Tax=Virgibacillus siamensis TaxID=480071 RepID=UPI003631F484
MDRFEQGLPDPQEVEVFGHCDECGGEIYMGQYYVKVGLEEMFCSMKCYALASGAIEIMAGE